MIVMRLRGRIGNQLFIYAFGRMLQERYKQELVLIDNENNTSGEIHDYILNNSVKIVSCNIGLIYNYKKMKAADYKRFHTSVAQGIHKEEALKKICLNNGVAVLNSKQYLLLYLEKFIARLTNPRIRYGFEKLFRRLYNKNGLFICENGFLPMDKMFTKDIFCFGYFQSPHYFDSIRDSLLKEIQPIYPPSEKNLEFVKSIESSESVCVSIRMGDYLNNPILGVCTPDYYQRAIQKMEALYPDCIFYIFSDDIAAVKSKIAFNNPVVFESDDNPTYEKIRYMSKCKHYILSNSAFSWWVQYLCEYEQKTVIAPDKWFAIDIPCNIYQENWILLPTN